MWVSQPPTKEDVLKFMELMHLKQTLVQLYDGMAKQSMAAAEDAFKRKVPDATEQQITAVDNFAEGLFKDLPVEELLDYGANLSEASYEGRLGRSSRILLVSCWAKAPWRATCNDARGGEVGGKIGQERMREIMKKMDEFIAEAVKQDKQKDDKTK